VSLAGQDGSCGGGVVGAGGGGDPAVAGAADEGAGGGGLGDGRVVVLGVPAVAQEGEREAGSADELLGGLVLRGQGNGRGIGIQDAGVDDVGGADLPGGVDHGLVLGQAAAHVGAGDQQQPVGPGEGRGQGFGPVVVRFADLHAAGGEPGRPLGRADSGDDLNGGCAAGKQVLHN
jgi:hypothetical protein